MLKNMFNIYIYIYIYICIKSSFFIFNSNRYIFYKNFFYEALIIDIYI